MISVCSIQSHTLSSQPLPLFAHWIGKLFLILQSPASDVFRWMSCIFTVVPENIRGQGIAFMRKNRDGFTKEEAKKLFYSFRGGNKQDDDGDDKGERKSDPAAEVVKAKTADEKIDKIIDYMRVTSSKLDRIEDDIQSLKEQVDRILEKI